MSRSSSPRHFRILVVSAAIASLVASVPATAAAHSDQTQLELLAFDSGADEGPGDAGVPGSDSPDAEPRVSLTVQFVYVGDGHAVEGARVVVAGESDGDLEVPPTELTSTVAGEYGTSIVMPGPGDWTLRVTSEDPSAELVIDVTLGAEPRWTATPSVDQSERPPFIQIAIGCLLVLSAFVVIKLVARRRSGAD